MAVGKVNDMLEEVIVLVDDVRRNLDDGEEGIKDWGGGW